MERVEGEIYSVLTSDEVARTIDHFASERPGDFFKLNMITFRRVEGRLVEVELPFLWVNAGTVVRITRLADRVEIIHCLSDGGRAVDIELGGEAERELRPARIRVQQ